MIKYANLKNYPDMDLAGHCPIFNGSVANILLMLLMVVLCSFIITD